MGGQTPITRSSQALVMLLRPVQIQMLLDKLIEMNIHIGTYTQYKLCEHSENGQIVLNLK